MINLFSRKNFTLKFFLFIIIVIFIVYCSSKTLYSKIKLRKLELFHLDKKIKKERISKYRDKVAFIGDLVLHHWKMIDKKFFKLNRFTLYICKEKGEFSSKFKFLIKKHIFIIVVLVDIFQDKTSVKDILSTLLQAKKEGKIGNIKIFICSALPYKEKTLFFVKKKNSKEILNKIKNVNMDLKSFCEKENFTYIDLHSKLKDKNNEMKGIYTTNGKYCNKKGYILIEKYIINKMTENKNENLPNKI